MKHSIRTRLFLSISCLIIFFVALSLLLNSQYLGKYYLWQKKQSLLEINKQISKKYQGNPLKLSLELERLEQNKGLSIFFIDQEYRLIYSTSMRIIEQPSIVLSVQPKLNALAKGVLDNGRKTTHSLPCGQLSLLESGKHVPGQ
jgi:hypothetical protein